MKEFIANTLAQNKIVTLVFINGQARQFSSIVDVMDDSDYVILETKAGSTHLVNLLTVAEIF